MFQRLLLLPLVAFVLTVLAQDSARGTAATELISVSPSGEAFDANSDHAAVSADGRFVAFHATTPDLDFSDGVHYCSPVYTEHGPPCSRLYVRDRVEMTTELLEIAIGGALPDSSAFISDISDDGRYVTFNSRASNLDRTMSPMSSQAFRRSTPSYSIVLPEPARRPTLGIRGSSPAGSASAHS
jgi:hypothetical protein